MDMREQYRPRRLRERPLPWPRRDDGDRPKRRPWEREPEPFEDDALPELYPGALVMDDLVATADDVATLRILARYTVIRVVLLSASGDLAGTKLRVERRIALEHLTLLPEHDWERRALERLAVLCCEDPGSDIIDAITIAAEAAAKRSQMMGAFALYRSAYELACAGEWWSGAAQAAQGIAQLARLEEARRSVRLWQRRAAILEKRAIRSAEAAAEAAAAAAETGGSALEPDGPGNEENCP